MSNSVSLAQRVQIFFEDHQFTDHTDDQALCIARQGAGRPSQDAVDLMGLENQYAAKAESAAKAAKHASGANQCAAQEALKDAKANLLGIMEVVAYSQVVAKPKQDRVATAYRFLEQTRADVHLLSAGYRKQTPLINRGALEIEAAQAVLTRMFVDADK